MSKKRKIVTGILTLVCGVMLVFAAEVFIMANAGKLMPLMEQNIGKTTSEIHEYSPELVQFLFTPMKAVSALLLSLTVGILLVLYGPFRKNAKWARISVFTPLILWLVLAIWIYSNQASAPWQIWLVLLVLVLIALALSLTEKRALKKSSGISRKDHH